MSEQSSAPQPGNAPIAAARGLWLLLDAAIALASLNPLWSPEGSILSWVTVTGIVAILMAIDCGSLREWGRVMRWLALPLAATLAMHRTPSPQLAMAMPLIGIAAGFGMAWTLGRIMRERSVETGAPRSLRFVWIGALAFVGYAGFRASHPSDTEVRGLWTEVAPGDAVARPSEFERMETLRLGPTNVLEIPGTFSGCELKIRVMTAWNAVLEVAWQNSPGISRTSFFVGTDPRVRTGFARRLNPDGAVESIGASGYGRQPYQRLDVTLRRVDGRFTAFVVDGSDPPESQRKQSENALAWADADSGRPCAISLLAVKGVLDVERVSIRPLDNAVDEVAGSFTWRQRPVILPLALLILGLAVAYACRVASLRNAIEGFLFCDLALVISPSFTPEPKSLLALTWQLMIFGTLIALLSALPSMLGPRRRFEPALAAVLSGILALGAFAYAPQLVDGRSPLRAGTLHDWRGRSYEPELAFLRHPPVRARNRYFEDHTFHGESADPLRTRDAKRIMIVGDASLLERERGKPAALAAQLDLYLSAYLRVGADDPVRRIECLDATAPSRAPSNLPALAFSEFILLARANPPEDADGKAWQGPDVEALSPDFLVFLVTPQESVDGSFDLLEEQVGPQAFRDWLAELREECEIGGRSNNDRLRQLAKPLLRLVRAVSTAQAQIGRACGLVFVLPPRKADGVAAPYLHSFGPFQLFAPVLPERGSDQAPCFGADDALTPAGQKLLARMLALVLAPQLASRDAR